MNTTKLYYKLICIGIILTVIANRIVKIAYPYNVKLQEESFAIGAMLTIVSMFIFMLFIEPRIFDKELSKEKDSNKDELSFYISEIHQETELKKLYFFKALFSPYLWLVIVIVILNIYKNSLLNENGILLIKDYSKYNLMLIIMVIVYIGSIKIFNKICYQIRLFVIRKSNYYFKSKLQLRSGRNDQIVNAYYKYFLNSIKEKFKNHICFSRGVENPLKFGFNDNVYMFTMDILFYHIRKISSFKENIVIIKDFSSYSENIQSKVLIKIENTQYINIGNDLYIQFPYIYFSTLNQMSRLNSYGNYRSFEARAYKFFLEEKSIYETLNELFEIMK